MPDAAANPQQPTPAVQHAICVAWSPVGVQVDERLKGALKRPGLEVAICDDPFATLACLAAGAGQGAAAKILLLIEPQRLPMLGELLDMAPRYVPNMAIWLFDPSRQPVLRSVKLGDALVLAGVVQAPAPAPRATASVIAPVPQRQTPPTIAPTSAGAPSADGPVAWTGPWVASSTQKWSEPAAAKLRLAGEGQLPARDHVNDDEVDAFAQRSESAENAPHPQANQAPRANPRVLSDEELAMLLGDEPPHKHGSGNGGRQP